MNHPTTPGATASLRVRECVAYGLGDTATNLVWRTLMVFLGFFYTDVFGLSAAAVGTLLLVSRFSDGLSDVVMGVIADRTETRWGKFRPWILWTAVPFGVLTVLTFTTPDLGDTGKLVYAYLTYNALILVFTASNVPYSAMTGVMSADPGERTRLSSYRFVGAFGGALLTQGLNEPLVRWFGGGDATEGYRWTMVLFATVAVGFFLVTFAMTKERVKAVATREPLQLRRDVADLLRNRPWLVLFALGLCFVTITTLKQGSTMYYFTYFLNSKALAGSYMVVGTVGALVGAALTGRLVKWWGRRRVVLGALAIMGLSCAAMYAVGREGTALVFGLGLITEAASGPVVTLFFSMLADAADFSEWKHRRRATGLVYSAGSLSFKFGSGVGGGLTGLVLASSGYAANLEQTPSALWGIKALMSVLPAVGCLVAFAAFWFYPLTDRKFAEIQAELAERRGEA
ncbi:MFS transporter [Actomonas aquatica]|uniref:MFS transporter n=1 Tax=Actomonas aquatica TaxID=2866162 RepID=A0ABZ1CDB6_9BACT|nr:MFS transporter [Opitutus sp. WL0086]WRQ89360.1 MFS transporter [Opitutus sp. WL0086]